MTSEINARYIKRQSHLKALTSAVKALSETERVCACIDGRIREVEGGALIFNPALMDQLDGRIREVKDEVDWLAKICKLERIKNGR